MRCPECGEASNGRLRYCENCGAKMPETPAMKTAPRPALRASKVSDEPAYSHEILEEVEERSRVYEGAPELAPEDKTDPGRQAAPAYDGPKWLAHVPAHSPTMAGVMLLALSLVLSILPFFSGAGVPGTLLALVACAVLVPRELRLAGMASGFTDVVPPVLLRAEVAALSAVVLGTIAMKMLGLGIQPLLWLAGAGLVVHDQWRKVLTGPEGVAQFYFEPRQLTRMPSVVGSVGLAVCLLTLFAGWAKMTTPTAPLPDNAPVPGAPAELRVVDAPRPSDDVLYTRGGDVVMLSGWDLPGSVLVALALLAALALTVLHRDLERPDWLRYAPLGAVGVCLVWAVANMRFAFGPIVFVLGLGAVGSVGVQQLLAARMAAQPEYEPEYAPVRERESFDENEQG